MKDCKIIQDLLPNYIEGLTNEETNKYIEEHLKGCEECKKVLNSMKEALETKQEKVPKQEVKYMRKFSKKLKGLEIILAIIIIIFITTIARKFIIIKALADKSEEYKNKDNYYSRMVQYNGDSTTVIEVWKKEDKKLVKVRDTFEDENTGIISYTDGEKTDVYYVKEKIAFEDTHEWGIEAMSFDYMYAYKVGFKKEFFIDLFTSKVVSSKCNGRDCYYFSDYSSGNTLGADSKSFLYIDKETGLAIRTTAGTVESAKGVNDTIIDCKYEFGTVTDEDVKEPDKTLYTMQ